MGRPHVVAAIEEGGAGKGAALLDLPCHPGRGWPVNPATGIVYAVGGRWAGKPLGRVGSHGYMVSTHKGRAFLLHRVVWEACVGPIPPRMVINHKNGNKLDNRLTNLEVVTSSQNNQHACDTGLKVCRGVTGPRNWNYRVTPEMKVDVLRRLGQGETMAAIARTYGLSPQTVRRVRDGLR